jgi:hypothetical protein
MEDENDSRLLPSAASATDTLLIEPVRKSDDFATSLYLRPQYSSSPSGRHLTPKPLAWSDGRRVKNSFNTIGLIGISNDERDSILFFMRWLGSFRNNSALTVIAHCISHDCINFSLVTCKSDTSIEQSRTERNNHMLID